MKNSLGMALCWVSLGIGAGTQCALAHHSFAMFDMTHEKTLVGTVKEFQWTNPHTWLFVVVDDGHGGFEQWGLEGMSPSILNRVGWSSKTLKPGDKITVVIRPLKNGDKGGSFIRATLADGTTISMTPKLAPGADDTHGPGTTTTAPN